MVVGTDLNWAEGYLTTGFRIWPLFLGERTAPPTRAHPLCD